jgi:asparagine synthase (glutamine-hydrolysing)
MKTDRASMAVSLEVRVPLLDHRFIEQFIQLPLAEKVRGGRGKVALREALRGLVSDEVLDGTKRGFDTPLRSWLRGPLADTMQESLDSLPASWVRQDAVQRRWSEHRSGARDHGNLLWSLLVLEQWRRRHEVSGVSA